MISPVWQILFLFFDFFLFGAGITVCASADFSTLCAYITFSHIQTSWESSQTFVVVHFVLCQGLTAFPFFL